ncbi:MAG TPA: hypothetical protein VG815_13375 [Chloroflexota bacterium]|jgi:hypothetical protein|nr:hypothetical protein [Chloroflexota bacterium]
METAEAPDRDLDHLVDRLRAHGITYLTGGSDRAAGETTGEASVREIDSLVLGLARAPEARLRDALISLLLRHPQYARVAEAVALGLPPEDVARAQLLLSIVVAAALQAEWDFSLRISLPDAPVIEADRVAAELGLPLPALDFGRPALRAAAQRMPSRIEFPVDHCRGWEDAVRRLLAQCVREARTRGA